MKPFLLPLTEPIGAIWLLMLSGLIYWGVKRQWKCAATLAVPTALIFLAGSTPLAERLVAAEERTWVRPEGIPSGPADAILVLGGGYYASEHDAYEVALSGGASRVVAGAELARGGVSTNLVLGGSWPIKGQDSPTTVKVQNWLESWELPGVTIRNLGFCWNTYDEAVAFRKLQAQVATEAGEGRTWQTIYLVTSALHMRRSLAVFRKQGIDATPIACDYQVHGTTPLPFSIFPSQTNLRLLALYLHEVIGRATYALTGKT